LLSVSPAWLAAQEEEAMVQKDDNPTARHAKKDRMLYRAVLEIPSIVMITDAGGAIEFVNPKFTAVTGYTFSEVVGKNPRILKSGKVPPEVYRDLWETILAGREWRGEMINRKKNGELYWESAAISPVKDVDGKITHFIAVTEDITERKRMEESLRESEERFRLMADTAPVMIWVAGPDSLCTFFNKPWLAFTGRSLEQEQGNGWTERVHPDDLPRCHDTYLSAFNVRRNFQMEYRLQRADGEYRWLLDTGVPRFTPNGDFAGYIGSCFDITERKRAEEALWESENKFSKAFQATPSVLVIASLADGRYTEVNVAFERVMGYRRDEVIGRSSLEINIWRNPEDRAMVLRMLAEGKKVRDLEIGFRNKSGTILVGLYSAEIIEIGAERCLLSLVNDITARKKAEEELRHSEERYRRLYNDTPVMLHSIDHDGRLISVSNYWLETLGYERSEVLGRISTEFLTAASRIYATEVVLPEFFRTGSCREMPYQIVKKNGEIMDVLLSAIAERDSEEKVVRSLAVMVDVTERKRAEEAVRKSEKKFLTVFHAVPALLGITTRAEGRFIDVNETCMRILGYQRDELIGRTALELGIWKSQADRDKAMRTLEEHGTERGIEINLTGKTGESFVGLMSAEFINIDDEQYILSMINDITGRKLAEEEIERLNTDLAARAAELEAANRELEAFNYTVAHDLRKPLTVVNGYCQAIRELCGVNLTEACKGYLREAYDGTLRMNRLIDALLNFSRLAHIEPRRETVDLSSVAQAVAAELQLAEPERRVTFLITEGVEANGDANLLRVVLDNLLGNAWKYTGTRDEVIIEFGTTEVDGKPAYFVRDNGSGFDMADAKKMFLPFQRLPGAQECKGFGIGLATVERIVRRHGGKAWAESEPGKEATFYFTLSGDRTI
jgi:PAS domain S-box-containing protein